MGYQNYHKHTHISNIIVPDSVVTNEDYCRRAAELGHQMFTTYLLTDNDETDRIRAGGFGSTGS